jgi:excisionase family DNA binding protein
MNTVESRQHLLTLEEAAAWANCSVMTLRRRIYEGALIAVRIGPTTRSPLRVPADELERWLFSSANTDAA